MQRVAFIKPHDNYLTFKCFLFLSFLSFFSRLTSRLASSMIDSLLSVIDPIKLPDRCPGEIGLMGSFIRDMLLPMRDMAVFLLYCSAVFSASNSFALFNNRNDS